MKKPMALILTAAMMLTFAGCGNEAGENGGSGSSTQESGSESASETGSESSSATSEAGSESSEAASGGEENSGDVMTYAEYAAAAVDTEVTVETYVQAKQSWWEKEGQGVGTFYTQDEEGGYFLYEMPCSKEDYDKLTQGTKIRVTGYKAEWSGEVEIIDATYEILEGSYVAEAEDVTALLGKDELAGKQNKFVSFKGMTVEPAAEGSEEAFLYKYDGSGQDGDDLYFNVSLDGNTYTFTVESYLCDNTTDVYAAVKELKVGDVIDMEGFMYWYEGPNPHITSVTAAN